MRALFLVPALLLPELLLPFAHAADATLSLDEAVRLALHAQPALAAQDARVQAATERTQGAGALPDPRLVAGFDNLAVDHPDPFAADAEPMTMTSIGLMQEFPNRARRAALTRLQAHDAALAENARALLARRIGRDVALAWLDVWQPLQAQRLTDSLADEARQLREAAAIAYRSGRGGQDDVQTAAIAFALIEDRLLQLQQAEASARTALRRWIGEAAEHGLPAAPPDAPHLPALDDAQARLDQHPELIGSQRAAASAGAGVELALSAYRPDWRVQAMYGYRRPFGDMVSLQVGFDLPVFTANRQDRALAAARADQDAAQAEIEDRRRQLRAALAAAYANEAALSARLARYADTVLPTAQARSDAALAAYRAGRGALDAVLSARRDALDLRLMQLDLQAQRVREHIQINYLLAGD